LHAEGFVLGKFLERKGFALFVRDSAFAVIVPKGPIMRLLTRKNSSPPRSNRYGLLATNLR
jgi:hypothetical protein